LFQGEHLVVVSSEIIQAGSPITAMFSDISWGTRVRRDDLLQTKYFACSCRRYVSMQYFCWNDI